MPNWCSNQLTLRHADPAIISRAAVAFRNGELLNEFIPCPQALLDTPAVCYPENDPRAADQLVREADNVKKYGHKTWYDWKVANWGIKWDVGSDNEFMEMETVEKNQLTVCFESAWSPPIEAYEKLLALDFEVNALYYEPGMAFCGEWDNGVDTQYDIPSTSAEAAKTIPDTIDNTFDIVNSMAMWEEDID